MASDGGFSTKPMGFDKNEVNEYIASLRKRMNEIEADKKANDEKTAAALKQAETADERVKAAEKAGEDKAAAIQEKLDIATVKADRLNKQVDDLKKQLEEEKKKMTDMLKTGKGVNAEAQKAYTEVIEKAEADAKEITDKAKETAEKIVADAESRRAEADEKLASFMELLRGQLDTINNGYKAVNESAAELLGSKIAAAPIEVPDFAAMAKSAEPAPEPEKTVETKDEKPEPKSELKKEEKPENKPAKKEKAAKPAPEPVKEEKPAESEEASFDDWGGNDLANSILADETRTSEVPLVNPDASKDLFGADLFGAMDSSEEDMTDISAGFGSAEEEQVEDIQPFDNSDHAKATPDSGFASDLIAQTMTSAHLDENADEDLLAAVRAQEEKFAVQPTVSVDELDMDENPEPALSDEEELMKALLEAEKSLGSLDDAIQENNTTTSDGLDSDNPWADLQKQLEAMEQSGLGMDMGIDEPAAPVPAPEPAAPSADDASIWNFGSSDNSGNSDDDMSGDAFGGFGGF